MPNALIRAIEENNIEEISKILKMGSHDINSKDIWNNTALITAIIKQNLVIVKILLQNGADVNIENISGNNALIFCIYQIEDQQIFENIFTLLIEYSGITTRNDLNSRSLLTENFHSDSILVNLNRVQFLEDHLQRQEQHQSGAKEFESDDNNPEHENYSQNSIIIDNISQQSINEHNTGFRIASNQSLDSGSYHSCIDDPLINEPDIGFRIASNQSLDSGSYHSCIDNHLIHCYENYLINSSILSKSIEH